MTQQLRTPPIGGDALRARSHEALREWKQRRDVNTKTPIWQMPLSTRAMNCLQNAEVETVGDLLGKKPSELMRVRNAGRKTIKEILYVLELAGMRMAPAEIEVAGVRMLWSAVIERGRYDVARRAAERVGLDVHRWIGMVVERALAEEEGRP